MKIPLRILAAAAFPLLAQPGYDPNKPLSPDVILLARIKVVMSENLTKLPNYTCTMTVERTRRPPKSRRFQTQDTVRLEVALVGGKELYAWPGSDRFEDREIVDMVGGGAIGSGDFAIHARAILFGNARHEYVGLTELEGRKVHQFRYDVPRNLSRFNFRIQPNQGIVGYRGSFWTDADSLDLVRLDIDVYDIPPNIALSHGSSQIEYQRAKIGESTFLLPRMSEMVLTAFDGDESRNRTTFANCRQYSGESKLTFEDPPPESAAPTAPVTRLVQELPSDLIVNAKLSRALNAKTLAIGDAVEAIVSKPARKAGREWLPKGAKIEGRVSALMRDSGGNSLSLLGLRFDRYESATAMGGFRGSLVLPEINYFLMLSSRLVRQRPVRYPQPPGGFDIATGYFYFLNDVFVVPSGLTLTWRTLEGLGDPKK